ncbi:MAG: Nucleolysin TIAR, partial [Paramarteilia canceri]
MVNDLNGTTKDELQKIFGTFGLIKEISEIKSSSGVSQFCFITFNDPSIVNTVLAYGEIKTEKGAVLRICKPGQSDSQQYSFYSNNYKGSTANTAVTESCSVYVGGLAPEIDDASLLAAFKDYSDIISAKVIKDPKDDVSKGYGFVTFSNKESASEAMTGMNGSWINTSIIKTNWASRKDRNMARPLKFEEMYKNTSQTNTTVYVGSLDISASHDELKKMFEKYGKVVDLKLYLPKGYGFVKYSLKDEACNAIIGMSGNKLPGSSKPLIANWGNEAGISGRGAANPTMPMPGINQIPGYNNSLTQMYDQYNPYGVAGFQSIQQNPSIAQNMQHHQ